MPKLNKNGLEKIKLILEKQMNTDQMRCRMWPISDPKKREQMLLSLAE